MSNKFKVGDKVRVLNADGNHKYRSYVGQVLTVSSVGAATKVDLEFGTYAVYCEEVGCTQFAHRFELVTEPKQFGIDDLRPFMRVVCRNGEQGIIAENPPSTHRRDTKFIILYTSRDSFDYANFEATGHSQQCYIVEVYAAPDPYYMLTPSRRGALLYVNAEVEAEKKRAIEEAKAKAKAKAKALLDAAQAAYDALN